MSQPGPSRSSRDDNSSPPTGGGSNSAGQHGSASQNNNPGPVVNFPQIVHVGRHVDGDTDEINVIVCTQRSRRRLAGELPRCYTFGWRHINHFDVPPAGKASVLPPKFGQEREVPGYWKERLIGSIDQPAWEGVDQDEDAEETSRPINYVEKREEWKEGNYLSYGKGSASAFEKIQGMHVPLHSYESHRRIREDLWTAERVAANMAKQQAKARKQHMKAEEQRRRAEAAQSTLQTASSSTSGQTVSTSGPVASAAHLASSTQLASTDQSQSPSSTSSASTSTAPTSSAAVKSKAVPVETNEPAQKPPSPHPPPVDRRFAPENIPHVPWYRRLWNYGPPPTGWTADEQYGHRSYIIPHPLHALKENLVRSWMLVLTPTWKLTKAITESYSSGAQRRFWQEMWSYSRDNGQVKLLKEANTMYKQMVAKEVEKQRQENLKMVEAAQQAMEAGDKVINQLESFERDGKVKLTPAQRAQLVELKRQRATHEEMLKKHKEELESSSNGKNDKNSSSS